LAEGKKFLSTHFEFYFVVQLVTGLGPKPQLSPTKPKRKEKIDGKFNSKQKKLQV
jgi:hypothetical protein